MDSWDSTWNLILEGALSDQRKEVFLNIQNLGQDGWRWEGHISV